ncbi:unnamed protein product [Adineta ricciae]|uniref:SGNH hydrolase-type esterase domain-containing protein n=1 Tax=Adineta ricciae TaxID=249248 RepID=A0A815NBI4_ADIRI|nr:unnamed protein product [Adineta ricciae]CAF1432540.1 unnamed protein product [Adineta ricciae]
MLTPFFACFILNLVVVSQQQSNNLILGFGDSYTSGGGGSGSYPIVAGKLLNWQAKNFAVGGSKMNNIPAQLAKAGAVLNNATHIVFTTGGNDLGVASSLQAIIINNNYPAVADKTISLKPQLVSTYKLIKASVRPSTKIYALPYVDFISRGNKIPNEYDAHRLMDLLSDTVKAAAEEAGIGFIEAVKTAFAGHEMYSTDPYSAGLSGSGAAHPNAKGYSRIGEVVADYIKKN